MNIRNTNSGATCPINFLLSSVVLHASNSYEMYLNTSQWYWILGDGTPLNIVQSRYLALIFSIKITIRHTKTISGTPLTGGVFFCEFLAWPVLYINKQSPN